MKVHVYRNRRDDRRVRSELHFCEACVGWYGVPHADNHCQRGWDPPLHRLTDCACAPCRRSVGKPIEGDFGFFTTAKKWQP